ncbi:helix-turn-helix domain-containing protein, partial [Pseudarthrobacter cellobiosi]|uniref:helix-turn-helix domain-containing protein n=1 Tax=Pseudarthrobacter cellobiosi TaxID=2953654 RepID=UPI00208EB63E
MRARLVQRARILLLAADGTANTPIAAATGASHPTVLSRRARYEQGGVPMFFVKRWDGFSFEMVADRFWAGANGRRG